MHYASKPSVIMRMRFKWQVNERLRGTKWVNDKKRVLNLFKVIKFNFSFNFENKANNRSRATTLRVFISQSVCVFALNWIKTLKRNELLRLSAINENYYFANCVCESIIEPNSCRKRIKRWVKRIYMIFKNV